MSNTNVRVKPVWRLNQGGGVPSDMKFNMLSASMRSGHLSVAHSKIDSYWSLNELKPLRVYAYETTRTKVGKYGWVDCKVCEGTGHIWVDYCDNCNGQGNTRELIK